MKSNIINNIDFLNYIIFLLYKVIDLNILFKIYKNLYIFFKYILNIY